MKINDRFKKELKGKNTAIYCRVSTNDQTENTSLEISKNVIELFQSILTLITGLTPAYGPS